MNFNINIQKQGGFYELSCVHLGLRVSKVYHGYSLADSIRAFQEYLDYGFGG